MKSLNSIPTFVWRILLAVAIVVLAFLTDARASDCACVAKRQPESWVFARGRYTHDPATGGRVAQYAQRAPVEPLPDQRAVSSGYRRTRTVLRGADGSIDSTYQVQSYGNGRGGLDAEWERFHDAWRGSTIGGGNFFGFPGYYGYPGYGFGGGGFFPGGAAPPAVGQPGFRVDPRQQFGPGFGRPDAGRLDPDGADGWPDGRTRTPDRRFFNEAVPTP
ncbi:MAG: hypothetical protein AAGD11_04875 [Planctomycetota bacterium]